MQASLGDKEPAAQDVAAAAARKTSQEQMQRLYCDSLVSQRSEIMLVEGMAIRGALQEKVRSNFHHYAGMPLLITAAAYVSRNVLGCRLG